MDSIHYLSPLEQMIYHIISKSDIIRSEEVIDLFPEKDPSSIRNVLSSLNKKGYLHRLKRGTYAVTPDRTILMSDILKISTQIYNGYLAFSTALRVHNLIDYETFTIFIATRDKSRTIRMGEYDLRYVSLGKRATGMIMKEGLWVSDLEKTIFDCIYRSDLAGGYNNITKAIFLSKNLDWDNLLDHMTGHASDPMMQRTGYLLDILRDTTGLDIPNNISINLQKRVRYPTRMAPSGPGTGIYSTKWKVQDNMGIDALMGWYENDG